MNFELLLVGVGGIFLIWLWAFIYQLLNSRTRMRTHDPKRIVPINLLNNKDGIIIAEGRGHLVYINDRIREWFNLNGADANLSILVNRIHPPDLFHDLFAEEGRATLRVGARQVEAVSHTIPTVEGRRMVVVLRELTAESETDQLDSNQALMVIQEISSAIISGLDLTQTMNTILSAVGRVIHFDGGEVTLWDQTLNVLRPVGSIGNRYRQRNGASGSNGNAQYDSEEGYTGWIARYRQPLLLGDVEVRSDVRPKDEVSSFLSYIGLPLLVNDRFIGTLELVSQERYAFDHEDLALLETIAGQAAVAIENARLATDQANRLLQLTGLQSIAQTMSDQTEAYELYQILHERLASLMHVDLCGLLLFDPDTEALVSQLPFYGAPDSVISLFRIPVPHDSTAYQLWQEAPWWYSNTVLQDDIVSALNMRGLTEALVLRTAALVPMNIGPNRIGAVLVANKRDGGKFNEDDMRLLSIFSAQATIVVENANLYERERRYIAELANLEEMTRVARSSNDTHSIFTQITERVAKLLKVEMCGFLFYEPLKNPTDDKVAILTAQSPFYGVDEESIQFYQIPVVRGSIFEKLHQSHGYWYSNELGHETWPGALSFAQLASMVGMRRVMLAPMTISGDQYVFLQVANKEDDFGPNDGRVLTISASQASVLLDNIQLYGDVQRLTNETEGLRRITEKVASRLTIDEIVNEVISEIAEIMDAQTAAIAFLEPSKGQLVYRPETAYGVQMDGPMTMDIYSGGFNQSPVMSRRPFRSADVQRDKRILPVYREMAEKLGIQNTILVPLVINQRAVGELGVGNKRRGSFDKHDERLLMAIAAQIAAAIERTRLYASTDADLQTLAQEQQALDRVSRELNQTLLLDRILEVIRGEALRTTQADDVSVVLFNPETVAPTANDIETRLSTQPLFEQDVHKQLAPVEQHMLEINETYIVEDYYGSDLDAVPADARSAIVQPIRFGEHVVGLIHIYTQKPHSFSKETVSFIDRLGQQASLAVSNARRYQEQVRVNERLRRRAQQVQQIFAFSQMLREGASLAELMQEVAHAISETVLFDKVLIRNYDGRDRQFRVIAQAGLPIDIQRQAAELARPYEDLTEMLQGDRWKISNSYFFPAELRDEWNEKFTNVMEPYVRQYTESSSPHDWNSEDLLVVPILASSGEIIGTISVDDPYNKRRPDIDTIELLEVFASQAAFIIENFRLVETVQKEAESARHERDRLAQLHLVSSEIQRAGTMSSRLQAVADGMVAGGWQKVQITLRNEHFETTALITSGYTEEEVQQLNNRLLPGKIWQERFNDLGFHELKLGSAYYLRYDAPWVQKHIWGGQPPQPATIADDLWHPQDKLYLPFMGHDQRRIIGLVLLDDPIDGKRPTESSLQPIELFALQAAAAIESTRLYNETVRQAETEQRLNELMEAMASTLDQTEIIRALSMGLQPFVVFTRMHLALVQGNPPTSFELTRVELTPDGKLHVFPDNPVPVQGSALGVVLQEKKTHTFDLVRTESTEIYNDLTTWSVEGERSVLMVPMIAGGEVIGILHLGSALDQSFRFTEEHTLTLIERMANLSAVSIQNSRLFSSLDESRGFNQAVVQSIQQGIVVLDDQLNLQLINAYMVDHYNWDANAVGRPLFAYRPEFKDFLEHSLKEVLRTGKELHQFDVQDIDSDGNLLIRNFYTYPLRQGERITGVVLLVEDITQRAMLEADLSNRAEQLSALTNVSSQMTETLQPDQVIEVVLDALDTVIPYDGVALWLIDPIRPGSLQILAARGFDDPNTASAKDLIGLRVDIEDSLIFKEMAAQRQVVNIGDTANDTRFPYGEARVYKNFLGAPLISKNEIIGVLQLEKRQPLFYRPHHEQLALAFANQAAVAFNNANLFAETQDRAEQLNRQTERLTLLNRVSVLLSHSLDIENILEITLRETALALGVEEAAAIQMNPDDGMCRVLIEYPRSDIEPHLIFPSATSDVINRVRTTLLPLAIESINESPMRDDIQRMLRRDDVKSTLFVPLVMSGSVIGIMRFDVVGGKNYKFNNDQIDLAQTLTNQAAIAVQNASLYEQSVQRTYQLETLFEAGQVTAGALDVDDVMRRVATQMLIALRADWSEVMQWDQVENVLRVNETKSSLVMDDNDPSGRGLTYDLDEFPTRLLVLRSQRVLTLRYDDEEAHESERHHMLAKGIAHRLLVPLVINEVSIGLVQIDVYDRARYFDQNQIRLVTTLANQAAVAIENARLQGETRAQIEELYIINDLSKAVSSTVVLDELLSQVRLQLPVLTEAQYVYVALYDKDDDSISFPVAIGLGEDLHLSPYHPKPTDEFGYILQKQSPLLLAGGAFEQARHGIGITEPMFPNAKSLLGVPMMAGEEFIGILALRDDENPRQFDYDDQRVLSTIGAQLAVAIQNAKLFRQTREFAQELESRVTDRTQQLEQERQRISTLYDIASEIAAATLDLDRVLNRTLEVVAHAIGATQGIILAIDDISDQLYMIAQRGMDVGDESERLQLRQNEGLAGWIIQNRQGVVIPNVQNDPRWIAITNRDLQPRSAVATLLESGDDVRGVIMFYSDKPDVFNDDHLRLVTAAASQLANSMNSAELYSLIRDQAERLGAILRQEQVEATKNTAILNSVADGVMYANERGIIRVFNSTAERILNLPSDQVLNRHIRELTGIYGGRASGWMDFIEQWMADPTQYQYDDYIELMLNLDDGRVINVRLSPVNMGDQFLGTVSVFRDITREAEIDRLKSEFVATVSHELRTPMTSIKGYADLLLLGAAGEMSEAQQRFLQTIKQNADRLSILVNDLLEVSRIDQGQMPLRFTPVDVNEVIQTVCSHLSGRIRDANKPLDIRVEVAEKLPLIYADFDKIVQVLQNIADNAFNYTFADGIITVGAHLNEEEQAVVLTIQDNGIGIPENIRPRIFERFFRGDEYSEVVMDTPGTGLGLAIVKELVNMHKGDIWFESELGVGTTFFIKIPIATDSNNPVE